MPIHQTPVFMVKRNIGFHTIMLSKNGLSFLQAICFLCCLLYLEFFSLDLNFLSFGLGLFLLNRFSLLSFFCFVSCFNYKTGCFLFLFFLNRCFFLSSSFLFRTGIERRGGWVW